MKKEVWKSMTFWGAVLLFIGGGMEALGITGSLEFVKEFALVLGIPITAFGIRRALK